MNSLTRVGTWSIVNTQANSAADATMNSTLAVECTVSRAAATTLAQVSSR